MTKARRVPKEELKVSGRRMAFITLKDRETFIILSECRRTNENAPGVIDPQARF